MFLGWFQSKWKLKNSRPSSAHFPVTPKVTQKSGRRPARPSSSRFPVPFAPTAPHRAAAAPAGTDPKRSSTPEPGPPSIVTMTAPVVPPSQPATHPDLQQRPDLVGTSLAALSMRDTLPITTTHRIAQQLYDLEIQRFAAARPIEDVVVEGVSVAPHGSIAPRASRGRPQEPTATARVALSLSPHEIQHQMCLLKAHTPSAVAANADHELKQLDQMNSMYSRAKQTAYWSSVAKKEDGQRRQRAFALRQSQLLDKEAMERAVVGEEQNACREILRQQKQRDISTKACQLMSREARCVRDAEYQEMRDTRKTLDQLVVRFNEVKWGQERMRRQRNARIGQENRQIFQDRIMAEKLQRQAESTGDVSQLASSFCAVMESTNKQLHQQKVRRGQERSKANAAAARALYVSRIPMTVATASQPVATHVVDPQDRAAEAEKRIEVQAAEISANEDVKFIARETRLKENERQHRLELQRQIAENARRKREEREQELQLGQKRIAEDVADAHSWAESMRGSHLQRKLKLARDLELQMCVNFHEEVEEGLEMRGRSMPIRNVPGSPR